MVNRASPHVDKKKAVKLSKSKGRMIGYPRVAAKKSLLSMGETRRGAIRDIDDIIKDMDKKERQSARHHKR